MGSKKNNLFLYFKSNKKIHTNNDLNENNEKLRTEVSAEFVDSEMLIKIFVIFRYLLVLQK